MEEVGKRGRPRLLVRHVTSQLAWAAVIGSVGISVFLTVVQFAFTAPQEMSRGMPLTASVIVHLWQLPITGRPGVWIAMMAAQLLILGSMTRRREYMAMLASGISVYQLTVPVMFVASVMSLASFALQEGLAPLGHERIEVIKDLYRTTPTLETSGRLRDVTYFASRRRTFIFDAVDLNDGLASGIEMHRVEGGVIVEALTARTGSWDASAGTWMLKDVLLRRFTTSQIMLSEEPIPVLDSDLRASPQQLRFEKLLASGKYRVDYLSIADLQRRIRALQYSGQASSELLTMYHTKWAASVSCIVIALICMPSALSLDRSGIGAGVSLCVVVCTGYGALVRICIVLGDAQKLSPITAAWLPHLLAAAIGLFLFRRVQT